MEIQVIVEANDHRTSFEVNSFSELKKIVTDNLSHNTLSVTIQEKSFDNIRKYSSLCTANGPIQEHHQKLIDRLGLLRTFLNHCLPKN